jgi:hypothetical protein
MPILNIIPFLNENKLKLIGIGYKSFTDKPYNEYPLSQMVEGGFLVEKINDGI